MALLRCSRTREIETAAPTDSPVSTHHDNYNFQESGATVEGRRGVPVVVMLCSSGIAATEITTVGVVYRLVPTLVNI